MNNDDSALLDGWKARRDTACLDGLVRKYAGIVHAAALRITRNLADADDVAQESFIALARTPPPSDARLAAWLHRVATRKAIDALRAQHRRHVREENWSMREPEAKPRDAETLAQLSPRVDEAIDALPDLQRTAIVLHFIQGLTHERIAEAEGVSRPAVTQRIRNGLDTLRKSLAPAGATLDETTLMGVIALPPASGLPRAADAYARIHAEIAKRVNPTAPTAATQHVAAASSRTALATKLGLLAATVALVGAVVYWIGWIGPKQTPASVDAPIVAALTPTDPPQAPAPAPPPTLAIETEAPPAPETDAPPISPAAMAEEADAPSIHGRVFDKKTGAGLAGVSLHVEGYALRTEAWAAGAPRVRLTTDSEGRYQTGQLPKGWYFVTLQDFPGYPLTKAGRARKTTEVPATPTNSAPVDFGLAQSGTLSGRITVNNAPMANMTVRVDSMPSLEIEELTSDEHGNYQIEGLGDYQGSLRARGRISGTFRATPYVSATVESGLTTRADFDFLAGSASVEGDILLHKRNGDVVPATGKIVVTYAYVDGDDYNIENMDLPAGDGHYLVESLWGGRVTVGLYPSIPGVHRHRYSMELGDGERARQDFHFYETRIDVKITRMPEDAGLDVWLVALPGRVEAVEGSRAAQRDFVESNQRCVGAVQSDGPGRGAGSLGGLAPGEYTILASGVLGSHSLLNHAAGDEYYRRKRVVRTYVTLPEGVDHIDVEMAFPEEP